jgi:elongation factor Ts
MAISMDAIKELRERTGAGVMDCKRILAETDGDVEKAVVELQKKGLAKAAKKAARVAAEGIVHAYIHAGSKVGVLIEVNCETDFVARNPEFHEFVDDLAMQVAAMNPQYVKQDEITDEEKAAQREIFIAQAKESGKPDNIAEKMVEGRMAKWAKEVCLLDQVFIKNSDMTIEGLRTALVAKMGENISVRRFVRFEVGEGIEKKKQDLAAEVAAELAKFENKD